MWMGKNGDSCRGNRPGRWPSIKIYNARIVGGTVKIKVKWKIDHLLTFYKDIAELNWFPISDGDEKVAKLDFYVDGLDAKQENCMPILVTLIHQPKSNGLKLVIIFGQRIFQKWKARTACLLANDRSPASRPSK